MGATTYIARATFGRLTAPDGRATTLDSVMGLSEPPVRVAHDGPDDVLVTTLPGVHAPESVTDDDTDPGEWTALSGFSGQHGYRGPVMHASEYIGGALARHILATPGDYAVATVDDAETGEPYGWVVLFREPAREPSRHDYEPGPFMSSMHTDPLCAVCGKARNGPEHA